MVAPAAVFVVDGWSLFRRYAVVRCSKILYSEGATQYLRDFSDEEY
jgi:hypothetical protein